MPQRNFLLLQRENERKKNCMLIDLRTKKMFYTDNSFHCNFTLPFVEDITSRFFVSVKHFLNTFDEKLYCNIKRF